jgi:hypothetical protein
VYDVGYFRGDCSILNLSLPLSLSLSHTHTVIDLRLDTGSEDLDKLLINTLFEVVFYHPVLCCFSSSA